MLFVDQWKCRMQIFFWSNAVFIYQYANKCMISGMVTPKTILAFIKQFAFFQKIIEPFLLVYLG